MYLKFSYNKVVFHVLVLSISIHWSDYSCWLHTRSKVSLQVSNWFNSTWKSLVALYKTWPHSSLQSMLLEVQAVTQSSFAVKSFMHITNAIAATKANYEVFAQEKNFFCIFVIFFSLLLTQRVLILKEMLTSFFFLRVLSSGMKKHKQAKKRLLLYFSRMVQ